MRFIKTFIIHLYIDVDVPRQLCGNLNPLPGRKVFPFQNQAELSMLLQQFVRLSMEKARSDQDLSKPNNSIDAKESELE
jgi:hypothetical protein